MGDLSDAIREHLELKRRRGADPAEVAREEHEALAPVTRSHPVVAPHVYDDVPEPAPERDAHEFMVPGRITSTRPSARMETIEIRRVAPRAAAAATTGDDDDATQEFQVERNGIWLLDDD